MSVVRARVDLKEPSYNASSDERWSAFKKLLSAFHRACAAASIQHEYKKHEHYESRGEKNRRKKREANVQRLKAKLKENFPRED